MRKSIFQKFFVTEYTPLADLTRVMKSGLCIVFAKFRVRNRVLFFRKLERRKKRERTKQNGEKKNEAAKVA